jgi:hypothetical protein
MPKSTQASREEFFELQITSLEKLTNERFNNMEKALTLQAAASEKAVILQTAEIARRLEGLNHENERLAMFQRTTVNKDVYEARHNALAKEVADLRDFKNNSQGKYTVIAAVVSAGISVLFLIIQVLFFKK